MKNLVLVPMFALAVIAPTGVSAQEFKSDPDTFKYTVQGASAQQGRVQTTETPQGRVVIVDDPNCESTLCNPLKDVDSIGGLIFKVINFVYSLSYAVIAVFLMISGFKFVMAQGSEDKLTDAKDTFKYTIIGAVLLIGANVITQVIKSLIDSFR